MIDSTQLHYSTIQ